MRTIQHFFALLCIITIIPLSPAVFAQWREINVPEQGRFTGELFSAHGRLLYAGSQGLLFSHNAGLNWSPSSGVETLTIKKILTLPNGELLAVGARRVSIGIGTATIDEFYRSADSGSAWHKAEDNLPKTGDTASRFIEDVVLHQGSVVVSFESSNNRASRGVYRSRDNGHAWAKIHEGTFLSLPQKLLSLDSVLVCSFINEILFSTNSGETWSKSSVSDIQFSEGGAPFVVKSFAQQGTEVFAATSDGLFRSANQGQTWERADMRLPRQRNANTRDVEICITAQGRLFAVVNNNNSSSPNQGVIFMGNTATHSTDWTDVNDGLPTNPIVLQLAVHGGFLYATVQYSPRRVWRRALSELAGITSVQSSSSATPRNLVVSSLTVFPQPVSEELHLDIRLKFASILTLELLDATGRRMELPNARLYAAEGNTSIALSLAHIPNGTYFCIVEARGERAVQCIVVSK